MSSLASSGKKHLFVINPRSFLKSGDISRIIAEITSCFQDFQGALKMSSSSGIMDLPEFYSPDSPYAIHVSRFPRDSLIIIRKYIAIVGEETLVRVYAIGGDGTAFCCLNGIVGLPNVELAIIPYGTGCDFVMSFGGKEIIPEMRNINAQIQAPVIPTDIIDCGNIYALNSCAVGFEAMALRWGYPIMKTFWELRRRFPVVSTAILRTSGIVKLFDKEVMDQHYRIEIDNEKIEGVMGLIHIANSPGYPINLSVIPEALPDDGLLDMVLYRKTSLVESMRLMPFYLQGKHGRLPKLYIYRRVQYVSISSDRPLGISLDGEVFFDTSFTVRIIPKAVKIASVGGRSFKQRSLGNGE
jgi:diacylglycerol kinase family enzyme